MRADIKLLKLCDLLIAVDVEGYPGSRQRSRGVVQEMQVARENGLPIIDGAHALPRMWPDSMVEKRPWCAVYETP